MKLASIFIGQKFIRFASIVRYNEITNAALTIDVAPEEVELTSRQYEQEFNARRQEEKRRK